MSTIDLSIQFGGGAELLFGKETRHSIQLPASAPATASNSKGARAADVTYLIEWMRINMLKEREELFVDGETV
jgi:ubiquitin related modifier 1